MKSCLSPATQGRCMPFISRPRAGLGEHPLLLLTLLQKVWSQDSTTALFIKEPHVRVRIIALAPKIISVGDIVGIEKEILGLSKKKPQMTERSSFHCWATHFPTSWVGDRCFPR